MITLTQQRFYLLQIAIISAIALNCTACIMVPNEPKMEPIATGTEFKLAAIYLSRENVGRTRGYDDNYSLSALSAYAKIRQTISIDARGAGPRDGFGVRIPYIDGDSRTDPTVDYHDLVDLQVFAYPAWEQFQKDVSSQMIMQLTQLRGGSILDKGMQIATNLNGSAKIYYSTKKIHDLISENVAWSQTPIPGIAYELVDSKAMAKAVCDVLQNTNKYTDPKSRLLAFEAAPVLRVGEVSLVLVDRMDGRITPLSFTASTPNYDYDNGVNLLNTLMINIGMPILAPIAIYKAYQIQWGRR